MELSSTGYSRKWMTKGHLQAKGASTGIPGHMPTPWLKPVPKLWSWSLQGGMCHRAATYSAQVPSVVTDVKSPSGHFITCKELAKSLETLPGVSTGEQELPVCFTSSPSLQSGVEGPAQDVQKERTSQQPHSLIQLLLPGNEACQQPSYHSGKLVATRPGKKPAFKCSSSLF